MIQIHPVTESGIFEIHLTETLTEADYADILTPALDAALSDHDRVRMLVVIGPEFRDFTAGAAWADARLGLRHWSGFDRIAVVSDLDWTKTAVRFVGFAFPGPVDTFDMNELDDARRWLTESLGSLHMTDLGHSVLHVQLNGKLDSAAYERSQGNLDAFIRDHPDFKLLLDLREFDGWQGITALGDHFKLVRDHRHAPTRIAVVGDADWQKLAVKLMRRLATNDSKYFESDHFEDARRYLT